MQHNVWLSMSTTEQLNVHAVVPFLILIKSCKLAGYCWHYKVIKMTLIVLAMLLPDQTPAS